MPDLAASRAAQHLHLADRVGREVVVQHELAEGLALEAFHPLLVVAGAEGGGDERLRFTAGEDGRAVRPWQEPHLRRDGADLVVLPSRDAPALVGDHPAHVLVLEILERGLDVLFLARVWRARCAELRYHFLLDLGEPPVTLVLHVEPVGLAHALRDGIADPLGDSLGEGRLLESALLLPHLLAEALLSVEELFDGALPEEEGLDHRVLVDFLGAAFHHEDRVAGCRHDHVEVALRPLLLAGIGDELAAHPADAHPSEGEREGDVARRQRIGSAGQREDVRVVLVVRGEDGRDDLRLVLVALREEWPAASVDEAGDEGLALSEPSFAPEEASRDPARRREPLLVAPRQGEEIEALLLLLRAHRRDEHHAVAGADDYRAVGLFGEISRLDRDGLVPDLGGHRSGFHGSVLSRRTFRRGAPSCRFGARGPGQGAAALHATAAACPGGAFGAFVARGNVFPLPMRDRPASTEPASYVVLREGAERHRRPSQIVICGYRARR